MEVAALPPPLAGEVNSSEARIRRGADAAPPSLGSGPPPQAGEEIRRVAIDFEAMVLAELLQPTFAQIDPDGLGGGGAGEQMFRPMLVQEYAQDMARAGGVGLADAVVRELTRLQAIAPDPEENDGASR